MVSKRANKGMRISELFVEEIHYTRSELFSWYRLAEGKPLACWRTRGKLVYPLWLKSSYQPNLLGKD